MLPISNGTTNVLNQSNEFSLHMCGTIGWHIKYTTTISTHPAVLIRCRCLTYRMTRCLFVVRVHHMCIGTLVLLVFNKRLHTHAYKHGKMNIMRFILVMMILLHVRLNSTILLGNFFFLVHSSKQIHAKLHNIHWMSKKKRKKKQHIRVWNEKIYSEQKKQEKYEMIILCWVLCVLLCCLNIRRCELNFFSFFTLIISRER